MKKIFVACMLLVLMGCEGRIMSLEKDTSLFYDDGSNEVVWYENMDYNFSLKLPLSMKGYSIEEVEDLADEDPKLGYVEKVNLVLDGKVVYEIGIHDRSKIELDYVQSPDGFEIPYFAEESDNSEYWVSGVARLSRGAMEFYGQVFEDLTDPINYIQSNITFE